MTNLVKHLGSEYGKQEQPTTSNDPYQQELQRQFEEGKAETDRINKLPQHEINRWLNEKE